MILLNDILGLTEKEIENTKIRFNKENDDWNPLQLFVTGNGKLMDGQLWNYSKRRSFKEGQIAIGFIRLDSEKWLLFSVSEITRDLNILNGVGYEYKNIEKYQKYIGRLIIRFKNTDQNLVRIASSVIGKCEVVEIMEDVYQGYEFEGYDNVNISYAELKIIINRKDWKTALINQKAIYLITDIESGKRYVGSAYGDTMLYGRWLAYVDSYHGGNKDLKKLDKNYIQENFRYSILEIFKSNTDNETILKREQFWMKLLLTKDKRFGYNN